VIGVCLLLILAACGSSRLDRGLSGAAIGAGTGAAVSALTSRRTIDLGRPIWRR
jgi:hypothetical protein